VHGLDLAPTSTARVDGYPRQVWRNPAGKSVIESYTIPTMAHGTPLATGPSDEHVGVPGDFLLDVGISSSYHIAKFWGLTGHPRAVPIRRSESASIVPAPPRQHRATAETSGAAGDPVGDAPKSTSPRPRPPPHRRAGRYHPCAEDRRADEVMNDRCLSRNTV